MSQFAPVNNHVATECMGPSPFSGGGPGREGGVPFNDTLELGYEVGEYSIVFNGAIQNQEVRVVKVVSLNPDQPNTPRVVNVPVEVTMVEGEEVIRGLYRVE